MISKHLKDIKKLLKAYHKKYNWEGKPVKKETKKRKKRKNGNRWFNNNYFIGTYNFYCSKYLQMKFILLLLFLLLMSCLGPSILNLSGIRITASDVITVPHKIETFNKINNKENNGHK